MPIPTNYTELQAEVQSWLARPGVDVTTYIGLTEREIEKRLRVRQMECRARALLNEEYEWLPAGFLDHISVKLFKTDDAGNVTEGKLRYKTQAQLTPEFLSSITASGSQPKYFTIVGNQIRFFPPPPETDSPYEFELQYFGKFDYLNVAVGGTNSILQEYPLLYLYGSLKFAAPFYGSGHRKDEWESEYTKEIEEANKQYQDGAHGTMAISMANG